MEPLRLPGRIHTVLRSVQTLIVPPAGIRAVKPPKGLAVTEAQAHEWVRYETYRGQRLTHSEAVKIAYLRASSKHSAQLRRSGNAGGIDAARANQIALSGAKHQRYYAQLQDQLIASEGPFEFRYGIEAEIDG